MFATSFLFTFVKLRVSHFIDADTRSIVKSVTGKCCHPDHIATMLKIRMSQSSIPICIK